jgi:hypothetical protein
MDKSAIIDFLSGAINKKIEPIKMLIYIDKSIPLAGLNSPKVLTILKLLVIIK